MLRRLLRRRRREHADGTRPLSPTPTPPAEPPAESQQHVKGPDGSQLWPQRVAEHRAASLDKLLKTVLDTVEDMTKQGWDRVTFTLANRNMVPWCSPRGIDHPFRLLGTSTFDAAFIVWMHDDKAETFSKLFHATTGLRLHRVKAERMTTVNRSTGDETTNVAASTWAVQVCAA
jgi:hypothetical protein